MADRATNGGGVSVPIAQPQQNYGPGALNGSWSAGPMQVNPSAGITTGGGADWFGPGNPLFPIAPKEVAGRTFDFQPAINLVQRKRKYEPIGPDQLRGLARGYSVLTTVIETRKDQLCALEWSIGALEEHVKLTDDQEARADKIEAFFRKPQRDLPDWSTWLRKLLDDLFVLDAPALYPRMNRGGQLCELVVLDGGTINRTIDDWGRTPEPPAPAYQQILHGLAAVDYADDDWPSAAAKANPQNRLIYRPRNPRPDKMFGFGPVEQVMMIINIAIRRETWQLKFFTEGSQPDALVGTPTEWTPDQVRAFQDWWDSVQLNETAGKRGVRFVPGGVEKGYVPTKSTELFGTAEEWLARVICFAFSLSPQAFTRMQNRATAETQKEIAIEEGVVPLKKWIKSIVDDVCVRYFDSPDLCLDWDEEEEIDRAALSLMMQNEVKDGIRSIDEGREPLGLEPLGGDFARPMAFSPTLGYVPISVDEQIADTKKKVAGGMMRDPTEPLPTPVIAPHSQGGTQGEGGAQGAKPGSGGGSAAGSGRGGAAASGAQKDAEAAALAAVEGEHGLGEPIATGGLTKASHSTEGKVPRAAVAAITDAAHKALTKTKDRVLGQIRATLKLAKAEADDIADGLDLSSLAAIVDVVGTSLSDVFSDSEVKALASIGVTTPEDLVNRVNEGALAWARNRAAELVGKRWTADGRLIDNPNADMAITETTRDALRAMIADGLAENIGTPALADKIEQSFVFSPERAALIAETEVSRANEQAKLVGAREALDLGVKTTKSWLTAGDEKCCDDCNENEDAGDLDLDEDFPSGDSAPPGHPDCRCVLLLSVVDSGEDSGEDGVDEG